MLSTLLAAALLVAPRTMPSTHTHRPERVGQCFTTRVKAVETRLVDGLGPTATPIPGSGSAIDLEDGHYMVDYVRVPGIDRSRPGDPVRLCVVSLPRRCPAGDTRGIAYSARNLRTGLGWKAKDSEHMCGGA